ncbi:hypothetical protein D9758_007660 [Tetrapyrgos nigripes]|uniref:Protein-S-isoprenylcysteine O-methyltransferase n=1 Tax=Tetrapyrgos nigripes TaxID=182062 RepID=A0A8H5G5E1_9AGAR|nr:hypothetical protein D9758_007660 [Tetrapyrgos nigripes]
MASSILKIPLIFASAALHHKAFTSPNPAPMTKRNYHGWVEKTLFRSIAFVTIGQKAMVWFLGMAETAVCLATRYPEWPYSKMILDYLMFGSDPNRIRLLTRPFLVGTGLMITGGLLRWQCYRVLGKMFTYEVSVQSNHKLVTTGPYRVVRHPAYTGVWMIIAGMFVWNCSPGSWVVESGVMRTISGKIAAVVCASWLLTLGTGGTIRAKTEDGILSEEFGEQWREWAKRVPYTLFPFIY